MEHLFNKYLTKKTFAIFTVEAVLIFATILFATAIRFNLRFAYLQDYDPYLFKSVVMFVVFFASLYSFSIYQPHLFFPRPQMMMKLLQGIVTGSTILLVIYYLLPSLKAWRGVLLIVSILLPIFLTLWRYAFSRWLHLTFPEQRVIIIGSEELAKKVGKTVYYQKELGLKLVGFIDDYAKIGTSIVNPGVIGSYLDIPRLVTSERIDRIIVATPDRRDKLPMAELLDCKLSGLYVEEGETFLERMTGKVQLSQLKPSWIVFSDGFKSLRSRKITKRIFDVLLSAVGLILSAPILMITAILIKLESKGPIIFRQTRVGENGWEFEIYKFRSMVQDAEAGSGPVWAGASDTRVTSIGKFIRKTRIDELPQLINVIKGDMSFVGPRPERPYFVNQLQRDIPYYNTRCAVKPGVTGWAQVSYPYGSTVQDALEKLQFDLFYIKNMSPILDMMIILMTVKVVLTGKGAR